MQQQLIPLHALTNRGIHKTAKPLPPEGPLTNSSGSLSLQKLTDPTIGLNLFFTSAVAKPVCNAACRHCYYFANYSANGSRDQSVVGATKSAHPSYPPITAAEIPAAIDSMRTAGYEKFYLITSEVLLAQNWKAILKASGDGYLNTNGVMIAKKGQPILQEISDCGVTQIVITANTSDSHDLLKFTPKAVVQAAFDEIHKFNATNPGKAFKTVVTVVLTSENFDKIAEICKHIREHYSAQIAKFVALIPFSE
ncbi:MAG: radical SAM protein, partial [Thaumarchaeota archaeon]|nr:radical SAM protein [Nitrososphaerota archaeon]